MYRIFLDDIVDLLFFELERVQDGSTGHEIFIRADSQEEAAKKLCEKLIPFFTKHFEEYN